MEVATILDELRHGHGELHQEAVEAAITQREAITPLLLDILKDPELLLAQLKKDQEYTLHLYALYLLAQFREQRACPLVVRFFALHDSADLEAAGEFVNESFGQVLASVCGGDTAPIRHLIEDPAAEVHVRGAGLDALVSLVVEGVLSREEAVVYFHSLFHGGLERTPSFVWDALVCAATDLYPEELEPEIRQAYAESLPEDRICDLDWVDEVLASGKDATLRRLAEKRHVGFIQDTMTEMMAWAYL